MKRILLNGLIAASLLIASCKKDEVATPEPVLQPAKGVYVLSEGNFGANNSKLAYRPVSGTVYADFFAQQNPSMSAGLGDLANDMLIYGGKMYIVMNGSGNLTVLNATTGTFISQVSYGGASANRNPRYVIPYGSKVLVSCWDNSVSVVDTTSLSITNNITAGATPEGIAIHGNYLYVANSGGLNYPNYDSTVSVIDLNNFTEVKKLKVGLNPQKIEVNSTGKVYVSAYGDAFGTVPVPPSVTVINGTTNEVEATLGSDYQFDHLRIYNDIAYFYNNYGGAAIRVYNTISNTLVRDNFITDGTTVQTTYGLNIDEQNGDVYITDAKDFLSSGEVSCYNQQGVRKFIFSISPGVNPNTVVFAR